MIGALWILIFTIAIGVILYACDLRWRKFHPQTPTEDSIPADKTQRDEKTNEAPKKEDRNGRDEKEGIEEEEQCCGLHLVCEKTSLSPMSAEIIYYDDEELDRFADRDPSTYTEEEEEEIREVFRTLRREDVLGWSRSLTQRHISLPADIRDSLILLAEELRNSD